MPASFLHDSMQAPNCIYHQERPYVKARVAFLIGSKFEPHSLKSNLQDKGVPREIMHSSIIFGERHATSPNSVRNSLLNSTMLQIGAHVIIIKLLEETWPIICLTTESPIYLKRRMTEQSILGYAGILVHLEELES